MGKPNGPVPKKTAEEASIELASERESILPGEVLAGKKKVRLSVIAAS